MVGPYCLNNTLFGIKSSKETIKESYLTQKNFRTLTQFDVLVSSNRFLVLVIRLVTEVLSCLPGFTSICESKC